MKKILLSVFLGLLILGSCKKDDVVDNTADEIPSWLKKLETRQITLYNTYYRQSKEDGSITLSDSILIDTTIERNTTNLTYHDSTRVANYRIKAVGFNAINLTFLDTNGINGSLISPGNYKYMDSTSNPDYYLFFYWDGALWLDDYDINDPDIIPSSIDPNLFVRFVVNNESPPISIHFPSPFPDRTQSARNTYLFIPKDPQDSVLYCHTNEKVNNFDHTWRWDTPNRTDSNEVSRINFVLNGNLPFSFFQNYNAAKGTCIDLQLYYITGKLNN